MVQSLRQSSEEMCSYVCLQLQADSPLTQPRGDSTLEGPGSQKPLPKVHLQMLPTGQLPQLKPTPPTPSESGTKTDPIQTLPPTQAVFPQPRPLPPVIPQHGFFIQQPGGQPLFMVMYPNMAGVQPQFPPVHFPQVMTGGYVSMNAKSMKEEKEDYGSVQFSG